MSLLRTPSTALPLSISMHDCWIVSIWILSRGDTWQVNVLLDFLLFTGAVTGLGIPLLFILTAPNTLVEIFCSFEIKSILHGKEVVSGYIVSH